MTFGILQRYVVGEVFRTFALALLTMTVIFVLFMVMAEASKLGLGPREIMTLVPLVIPSTFPYTVPVSLLFSVTVVYGRLASDNEIIAVKTAGMSALTVLWPSMALGGMLTVLLLVISGEMIPRATLEARLSVFRNLEEMFYTFLKKDREFNNPKWPFLIKVVDVRDKTMIDATFKHRERGADRPNAFDMTVQAKRARIQFDTVNGVARIYLDGAEIAPGRQEDVLLVNDRVLEFPIPDKGSPAFEKRIQEWTTLDILKEQALCRRKLAFERRKHAVRAALLMASGRLGWIDWPGVQTASNNHSYWSRRVAEFETEKQLRVAQSFGSFIFVVLGAPVGILFARRDFLSAFITCFMPIIIVYYPLMLLGVNVGKEDILNPTVALWSGNVILAVLAGFVLPPIIRH